MIRQAAKRRRSMPLRATVAPSENDILFGKVLRTQHLGNRFFRQLIKRRYREHEAAEDASNYVDRSKEKRDKMVIKREILAAVKDKGGRFLERTANFVIWEEMSETEAIAKIDNAFRNLKKMRRSAELKMNQRDSEANPACCVTHLAMEKNTEGATPSGCTRAADNFRRVSKKDEGKLGAAEMTAGSSSEMSRLPFLADEAPSCRPGSLEGLESHQVEQSYQGRIGQGGSGRCGRVKQKGTVFDPPKESLQHHCGSATSKCDAGFVEGIHAEQSLCGKDHAAGRLDFDDGSACGTLDFGRTSGEVANAAHCFDEADPLPKSPQSVVNSLPDTTRLMLLGMNALESLAAESHPDSCSVYDDRSRRDHASLRSFMESLTSSQHLMDSTRSFIDAADSSQVQSLNSSQHFMGSTRSFIDAADSSQEQVVQSLTSSRHLMDSTRSFIDAAESSQEQMVQEPLSISKSDRIDVSTASPSAEKAVARKSSLQKASGTETDIKNELPTRSSNNRIRSERTVARAVKEATTNVTFLDADPHAEIDVAEGRLEWEEQVVNKTLLKGPASTPIVCWSNATKLGTMHRHSATQRQHSPRDETGTFSRPTVRGAWRVRDDVSVLATCNASPNGTLAQLQEKTRQMSENPDDTDLQVRCCLDVSGFFRNQGTRHSKEGLRRAVHRSGVAKDLLHAVHFSLQQHLDHPKLTTYALQTREYLRPYMDTKWLDNINRKTIETSVTAMRREPCHDQIQENGCRLLTSFAKQSPDSSALVVARGGILAIVSAMKEHPSNRQVQETGCLALSSLAEKKADCRRIAGFGGISVILKAMQEHHTDYHVHENACKALCMLAKTSPHNCWVMVGSLVRVMQRRLPACEIQKSGCRVLQTLAEDRDRCRWIVAASGITTVLDAMWANRSDPEIQETGCATLFRLANCSGNCEAIIDADAVAAAVTAMHEHPDVAKVQKYGLQTLCNLLYFAPVDSPAVVAAAGGMSALVVAMRNYVSDVGIQTTACRVLKMMVNPTTTNTNCEFVAENGVAALVAAMKYHFFVEGIQENGSLVLRRLMSAGDWSCLKEIRKAGVSLYN